MGDNNDSVGGNEVSAQVVSGDNEVSAQVVSDDNKASAQNASNMTEDQSSVPQDRIYESLKKEDKIYIYGGPGVGKTKRAKRLSKRAMRYHDGAGGDVLINFTLWVFMCIQYTKESLLENIARQLFLLPITDEEWEDEDEKNEEDNNNEPKNEDDNDVQKNEDASNVQKNEDASKVPKKKDDVENAENIVDKIQGKLKGVKVLLILDDDALDNKTQKENETKFWSLWKEIFPSNTFTFTKLKKIFISRSKRDDSDITEKNAFEVKPLPDVKQSKSLLIEKLDPRLTNDVVINDLGEKFIKKVGVYVPGRITMLAKSLSYFGLEQSGISRLKKELEEASENYNVSRLLCFQHDVLPLGVLKDLWWRGHHFFRDSGSVHFSELITYWILEGYLGSDTMTKLYKKGHGILMELMDCGVLKEQEGGYVSMDNSFIDKDDLYQYEHVHQTASLGLATLFTSNAECFGRITHKDGMLKTPRMHKEQSSKEKGSNEFMSRVKAGQLKERILI